MTETLVCPSPIRANLIVLDRNPGPDPVLLTLDLSSTDMPAQLNIDRAADVGEVVFRAEARTAPKPNVTVVDGQLMATDGEGGWAELLATRLEPGTYQVVAQNTGHDESYQVFSERLASGDESEVDPIEKWWVTFVGPMSVS